MARKRKSREQHWADSRAGGWAARGFNYQHLVVTLFAVRLWADASHHGTIVPEGLDDCTIEFADRELWLQVKSRAKGAFPQAEITRLLQKVGDRAHATKGAETFQTGLVLEAANADVHLTSLDKLIGDEPQRVTVVSDPFDQAVSIVSQHLNIYEIIAENIVCDLYRTIAQYASDNASRSYADRRRLTVTDTEHRVQERLKASDSTAIGSAISSGALRTIDFATSVNDRSFYLGVKSVPGHIGAGLILARQLDSAAATDNLQKRRSLLIHGPSGCGKSALAWLITSESASNILWFQVSSRSTSLSIDSILAFVRARRPSELRPVGLILDDITGANSPVWDNLVHEIRNVSDAYLLGTIRQEDLDLIETRSESAQYEPQLNEQLAEEFWRKLRDRNQSDWSHWREPFEQSGGLLLEYMHILTQGEHLVEVIRQQIHIRQRENRNAELAILRCAALISAWDGEIVAATLAESLGLSQEATATALRRLLNEHLVRESREGVLGGLHTVRSHALADASHDGVVFSRTESLWTALPATTPESMPGIIRQVLAHPEVDRDEALERLAQALAQSPSIQFWTAVLTGLGLGTLDGQAERFMALLERHAVPRSLWFLASMFFDSSTTVPDLEGFDHVAGLQRAVDDFRNLEMPDYRTDCLSILPADAVTPHCSSMEQATRFLAALAPIGKGEPISVKLEPEFGEVETIELDQLTTLLSAASTLNLTLATQLVEHLGGEERLFNHFTKNTPWIDRPEIVDDEEHGRTVSTQWYRVSEDFQPDPHDTIVAICKWLVALSPRSNAAACRVVTPTGERYPMTEEASFEKCIPRENLPSPIRVAWNVAFRQLLLSRASVQRLTDYAVSVANLFHRTERVFHKFSERWASGKTIHGRDELAQEINNIIGSAQSLSHATPNTRFSDMTSPLSDGAQDEPTASTISGILGNLVPRMAELPGGGNERGAAMFAADLSAQVSKLTDAPIWRTVEVPPRQALEGLRDQLAYVSAILHEMASDASSERVNALVAHAKQARTGNRCRLTALYARRTAEQRFDRILRNLEADLAAKGLAVECKTKPDLEPNSVFWPPAQLCVLLQVSNFEAFLTALAPVFEALDQTFPDGLVFRIAPFMNNQVIGTMGMLRVRDMPMASPDFAADWRPYLDHQLAPNTFTDRYQQCMNAMLSVSAIATCRDMDSLHHDEEAVLIKVLDTTSDQMSALAELIDTSSNNDAQEILAYMFQLSDRVSQELEDARRGDPPTEPICAIVFRLLDGIEDDDTETFAGANLLASQILI